MSSRKTERRIIIVDRKWQFHIWRLIAGTSLSAGILYLMAGFALMRWLPIDQLSGEEIEIVAFSMNAAFFVAIAISLLFVTLRVTHTVAGPAMILKTAIEGLQRGEYHHRCTLRQRDYLQDLAAAVQKLQEHLRDHAESQKPLSRELDTPVAQGPELVPLLDIVPSPLTHIHPPVEAR